MKRLEQRILEDGVMEGEDVLKVDSFLNHQMDVGLFAEMGKEWARLFADDHVTKILTIEASGIGIACVVAQQFGVPVLFAKKNKTKNIAGEVYSAQVESFTHGRVYDIIVSKKFLGPGGEIFAQIEHHFGGLAPPVKEEKGQSPGEEGHHRHHRNGGSRLGDTHTFSSSRSK